MKLKECKLCGKKFIAGHGNRRYCYDDECKSRYVREKEKIKEYYLKNKSYFMAYHRRRAEKIKKHCVLCKKEIPFIPGKRRAKYCCNCKIESYKQRLMFERRRTEEFNKLSKEEQLNVMMAFSMDFIKEGQPL